MSNNQALANALSSDSTANYSTIFAGFIAMGIPEEDIKPRENVFTYDAWQGLGRQVRRYEHGVKVVTYKAGKKKDKKTGKEKEYRWPKKTSVFHISQTDSIEGPGSDAIPEIKSSSIAKQPPKGKAPSGDKLRALAGKMQAQIDDKMSDRLANTPKRLAQARHAQLEGQRLQRTQDALTAMADLCDAGTLPPVLEGIKSKKAAYDLLGTKHTMAPNGYHSYSVCAGEPRDTSLEAAALWALLTPESEETKQARALKEKIDGLNFTKIPGFFSTPPKATEDVIESASIEPGHIVLEPNLGSCALADAAAPLCKEVRGYEINFTLAGISEAKGYLIEQCDFLEVEPDPIYDRVIMNPPFEKLQDTEHVRHAYKFLKPEGRLVSIMSPSVFNNSTKKAAEFREWFELMGGYQRDLPAGSFKESGTGVPTCLVVLDNA